MVCQLNIQGLNLEPWAGCNAYTYGVKGRGSSFVLAYLWLPASLPQAQAVQLYDFTLKARQTHFSGNIHATVLSRFPLCIPSCILVPHLEGKKMAAKPDITACSGVLRP